MAKTVAFKNLELTARVCLFDKPEEIETVKKKEGFLSLYLQGAYNIIVVVYYLQKRLILHQ